MRLRATSRLERGLLMGGLALLYLPLLAQQPADEEVIVTAHADPVPFASLARTVTVLTHEDLARLPVSSVTDALRYASTMDLRQRGPFGAQADFSIRGSSFGQVLVLLDGVRMNDSQTGHHNSDFPVSVEDIERIEVLSGPGSSLYGADAFGGAVNIVTRKPEDGARAGVSFGQYGLVQVNAKAGRDFGRIGQSVSLFAARSSDFLPDRDFRTVGFNSRTELGRDTTLSVAYVDKDFGAAGFYGPAPSREWTNQTVVTLDRRLFSGPRYGASLQAFYRTHGDRFLWDIDRPSFFENSHRTHAVGLVGRFEATLSDSALLSLAADAGSDWIRSTSLGEHSFTRTSVSAEMQLKLGKSGALYPGVRLDHYAIFGAAACPSLSGSYWVRPTLRVRSSVGRAFRAPTFTERYYQDPNHQASAALGPEESWGAETGLDWILDSRSMVSLNVFSRWEDDVIDWTRVRPTDKWVTSNLRNVTTHGVEATLERNFASGVVLRAGYIGLSTVPGQVVGFSKYALDYARHSWTMSAAAPLVWGISWGQRLDYRRRSDGRKYLVLDSRLTRRFGRLTARLDCSNLLNTSYQEVLGVDMPGRWLQGGIEIER